MKRQTLQKKIILETLDRLGNHPTPAEVYEELHKKYPSISQATVFRVLSAECGETVQKIPGVGGGAHYEYGTRKHYHVSCRVCGKVSDIEMPYINGLEENITDSCGYTVENYYLEFVGICPDCRAKSDTDKNKS